MGGYYAEHRTSTGQEAPDIGTFDTSRLPTPHAEGKGLNTSELEEPKPLLRMKGVSQHSEGSQQFSTSELPAPYAAPGAFNTMILPEPKRVMTAYDSQDGRTRHQMNTKELPAPSRPDAAPGAFNTMFLPEPKRVMTAYDSQDGRTRHQMNTKELPAPSRPDDAFSTINLSEPQRLSGYQPLSSRSPDVRHVQGHIPPVRSHHPRESPKSPQPNQTNNEGRSIAGMDRTEASDPSHKFMSKRLFGAALLLRACEMIVLLASVGLNVIISDSVSGRTYKFSSFSATTYAFAVAVIGVAYSTCEMFSLIIRLSRGRYLLPGPTSSFISCIGDQVIIVLLLTGGAAAASVLKNFDELNVMEGREAFCDTLENFCTQMWASVGALFLAFILFAASFCLSSYCLYRRKV
ncbi:hypothetical protein KP509_28G065800 [Ceratopteris richardii]|uniref:CASP-like protein n=1 Tax=Ceratopteris richardii TaxID=49495 RepID=A0A8T2RFD9_CERRI|nr:hypothetical protein KP509_28G065800 [Ceratopteris richardii]